MNKRFRVHIGASSILIIFVLLCLVTFAMLSLVSANADYKLSEKTAQSVTCYYQADAQAETQLTLIEEALKTAADRTPDGAQPADFYKILSDVLLPMDGVSTVMDEDTFIIQYQMEIDNHRALQVSLQPVFPLENPAKRYTLTGWQVIQTSEWNPDNSIPVWDGAESFGLWSGEEQ